MVNTNLVSNKGEWNNYFIKFSFKERPESDFMLNDICRIHFHIMSNAGIMAGNRDPVNK